MQRDAALQPRDRTGRLPGGHHVHHVSDKRRGHRRLEAGRVLVDAGERRGKLPGSRVDRRRSDIQHGRIDERRNDDDGVSELRGRKLHGGRPDDLQHRLLDAFRPDEVHRERRACVRLDAGGRPVTLVVAEGTDPCSAHGRVVDRAGRKYLVHMMGSVNMAMTARDGRWLCVMGELPDEDLLKIAEAVKF
jgi:hypothetical protein